MSSTLPLSTTSWGLLERIAPHEFDGCDPSLEQAHRALLSGAAEPALAAAAAALKLNRRDPLALVLSADGFTACGKRVEALELLLQASADQSCSPAFCLLPAEQLMSLGRAEEAQLCLERGLAALARAGGAEVGNKTCIEGAGHIELHLLFRERLARSMLAQGLVEQAWLQLEGLVPLHPELNGLAAELLLKLDRTSQALLLAQKHHQAVGTATSAHFLARCYFRCGDQAAYAETLRVAGDTHPQDVGLASLAAQATFDSADDPATLQAGWQRLNDAFSAAGQAAELKFLEARQLLLDGHLEEGWAAYEARLQLPNNQLRVTCPMPWNGESPNGRPVVVVAEQGVGDILFFARFLPTLAAESGTVFLLVESRLVSLLRRSYPEVVVLEQPDLARALSGERALWIPLGSLPIRYGSSQKTIAAGDNRQLQPQAGLIKLWNERMADQAGGRLRVGVSITAGGGTQEYQQRKRDVDPNVVLPPLCEIGAAVIDLQHRAVLQTPPQQDLAVMRFKGITRDLDQLCALISQLDLLITSDQTNAFLGGILGSPTLAVVPPNPHFMFGRQGAITPWFSSLRIARARHWAGWQSAQDSYSCELEAMLSGT